ncbi:cytochrome b [Magnetospirillum sp. UT-4]|uniref:cytochrome b n=1 Tax=Magnetospirillum sp. UT-4 TaxID=2681467 RepID=UPI001383F66E|nr:cytochrome b [Magnetospirillum sp. UT-4]CAA7614740.1 Cytochrome B561 [Magnetospirillum sp. UT-4]
MTMPARYPAAIIALHWLMAALIIVLWAVGLVMEELPKGDLRGQVFGMHKAFGVVVLALLAVRLSWRAATTAPELPGSMPPLEQAMARLGHLGLYVLMVALPVSGILMSQSGGRPVSVFGPVLPTLVAKDDALHEVFEAAHAIGGWLLAAVLVAHVVAALRHRFILRDDIMQRMLPERK